MRISKEKHLSFYVPIPESYLVDFMGFFVQFPSKCRSFGLYSAAGTSWWLLPGKV